MQKIPTTSGELIRQLETLFPEVIAKPGDSPDKLFHASGQRSVVHFLKQWRDGALESTATPRPRGAGRPTP